MDDGGAVKKIIKYEFCLKIIFHHLHILMFYMYFGLCGAFLASQGLSLIVASKGSC